MKIEITKKQYNYEIHMNLDTGDNVDQIEHETIKDCLNELNLDETWKKKQMLRQLANEIKKTTQHK